MHRYATSWLRVARTYSLKNATNRTVKDAESAGKHVSQAAKDSGQEIKNTVKGVYEATKEHLKDMAKLGKKVLVGTDDAADASSTADTAANVPPSQAKSDYEETKANAKEMAHRTKEAVKETAHKTKEAVKETAEDLAQDVKEHAQNPR